MAPPAAGTPAGSSGRASGGGNEPLSQLPSTSGRRASEQQNGSAAAGDHISYADVYRQAAMQAKQAEQASILRRIKGCARCCAGPDLACSDAFALGWMLCCPLIDTCPLGSRTAYCSLARTVMGPICVRHSNPDLNHRTRTRGPLPRRRASLFYHQQAMTWGWYMLEPWETLLWMGMLLSLFWLVVSACFLNPSSICGTTLAAARKALADQGGRAAERRPRGDMAAHPGWSLF